MAVSVMVLVRVRKFLVALRSVLDISATGLDPYLRHDIRIRDLKITNKFIASTTVQKKPYNCGKRLA